MDGGRDGCREGAGKWGGVAGGNCGGALAEGDEERRLVIPAGLAAIVNVIPYCPLCYPFYYPFYYPLYYPLYYPRYPPDQPLMCTTQTQRACVQGRFVQHPCMCGAGRLPQDRNTRDC
jgi:hypothetical protein